MEDKKQFYNSIIEAFCNDGFYYENLRIETPIGFLKSVKRDFDLIVFNNRAIIAFVSVENNIIEADAKRSIRASLNSLANKLSVSLRTVIICAVNEQYFYFLNSFNDRLRAFNCSENGANQFMELLCGELDCRPCYYKVEGMKAMGDKLVFSANTKGGEGANKIKTTSDGRVYVRKQGVWREASDVDSDQAYFAAALFGMLGVHLFYLNKTGKGILYLLTLGLFGVGWFFDSLEMLLGIYKDREGRYLLPVSNKLLALGILIAGAGVFWFVWTIVSFILSRVIGLF